MKHYILSSIWFFLFLNPLKSQNLKNSFGQEPYRPTFHFTPKEHWMNDPNGLVYYKKKYHLFFQYYPLASVWGPMHWGHAESKDLTHWKQLPIALFPDSLGYIFSGSAVVDIHNTSGLGKNDKIPLVAIFTQHDPKGEKEKKLDYQNESIAYSIDGGYTWTKYKGNPVLKNPGIQDFRDPNVSWYEEGNKWIMTLATHDRITFYSSPNLISWKNESEFGQNIGAHGGVWECPDLFPILSEGKKVWVLLVSINPGGPNGGSGTQYFTGKFDGVNFRPNDTITRWIDYGPDDYAGVTWKNTGERKIFLGWMSNWEYATSVPTNKWRSAMTLPRDLFLKKQGNDYVLCSIPSHELKALNGQSEEINNIDATDYFLKSKAGVLMAPYRISVKSDEVKDFKLIISNDVNEKIIIGYDKKMNRYYFDRKNAGNSKFQKNFAGLFYAPRQNVKKSLDMTLYFDVTSVELFADNGMTVMSGIFFPTKPFNNINLKSNAHLKIKSLTLTQLKSFH